MPMSTSMSMSNVSSLDRSRSPVLIFGLCVVVEGYREALEDGMDGFFYVDVGVLPRRWATPASGPYLKGRLLRVPEWVLHPTPDTTGFERGLNCKLLTVHFNVDFCVVFVTFMSILSLFLLLFLLLIDVHAFARRFWTRTFLINFLITGVYFLYVCSARLSLSYYDPITKLTASLIIVRN